MRTTIGVTETFVAIVIVIETNERAEGHSTVGLETTMGRRTKRDRRIPSATLV